MKKTLVLFISLVLFTSITIAQTREEKKQQKEEKANKEYAAIKKLIDSKAFVFDGIWLTTQKGRRVDISSGSNRIEVKKDSANAYLQYFGVVHINRLNPNGGIVFDNIIENYRVKYIDKKRRIRISFTTKNKNESFDVSMTIQRSGFTFVDVFSVFRSSIKYEGNIKPLEED
jgi:hypothetical protein